MLKRIIVMTGCLLTLWLVASIAFSQTPKAADVAVKDTPASQTLNQMAKDQAADQQVWNTKLQQARFSLDANVKTLNDQIQSLQKDLETKLKQDKKYKPFMDQIADAQKKLKSVNDDANTNFTKDTNSLQQKIKMESDNVTVLIPVVRKENGLPDGAQYNAETQKWTMPEAPKAQNK